MGEFKKVFWLGVTPLERGSERAFDLARFLNAYNISFPDSTSGMGTYDEMKCLLMTHDVLATDQEVIDKSYEEFFCAENWGKQIVQYKNGKWSELKPGFSTETKLTKKPKKPDMQDND